VVALNNTIPNEQNRGSLVLLEGSAAMDQMERELERKLAQTKRLAMVSSDPTTQQRLNELKDEISRQLDSITARKGRITEDHIRARAFDLWEQYGCPAGRDEEFWLRAEQELIDGAENDS
jgi:hypothetical protein